MDSEKKDYRPPIVKCHSGLRPRFATNREQEYAMSNTQDNTEAMKYVKSLRDAVKRRFAITYLEWIRAGRIGIAPNRGLLSPALAKSVAVNLDSLS
jgi:hypothetical protein